MSRAMTFAGGLERRGGVGDWVGPGEISGPEDMLGG
jgi:hypothetical protein